MNGLERYLLDRRCSERMVRKEILRARAILRDAILVKVSTQKSNNKMAFNINPHPLFCNIRKILEEIHVVLAQSNRHRKCLQTLLRDW